MSVAHVFEIVGVASFLAWGGVLVWGFWRWFR